MPIDKSPISAAHAEAPELFVDIEVYDTATNQWAQARYLAHGVDDLLWTNDLDAALAFLRAQLTALAKDA